MFSENTSVSGAVFDFYLFILLVLNNNVLFLVQILLIFQECISQWSNYSQGRGSFLPACLRQPFGFIISYSTNRVLYRSGSIFFLSKLFFILQLRENKSWDLLCSFFRVSQLLLVIRVSVRGFLFFYFHLILLVAVKYLMSC